MTDETMSTPQQSTPWDQEPGEPANWYRRFCVYRLLGHGRSIDDVFRAENINSNKERKRVGQASSAYYKAAKRWRWKERCEAWDQSVIDANLKQVEERWQKVLMAETELLGRLSEMSRVNINDFLVLGNDGHIIGLNKDMLEQYGYLVKRISSSEGKTNSIAIEMYDAQTSINMLGKKLKLWDGERETAKAVAAYSLPAEVLASQFLNLYRDIRAAQHSEYVLYGGRGSTKSTFISLAIIFLLINNPMMHALATRQVANTLRDSVYSQLVWAINELGFTDHFKCTTSPLEITYIPTGQKIYFRGADDPGKIKSIKPAFGYIGILWFEELDQFHGEESIRKIEQSVIRGGDLAYMFKSFNPPRTLNNWANKYVKIPKNTQLQHYSTYLDVPPEWLGKTFLEEAGHLKEVNPKAYEHEYLGVANSAGGLVFENVTLRQITDEEIQKFDRPLAGIDWGYYPDPAHFCRCHYDAARMTLYIYAEYRVWKTNNQAFYRGLVDNLGLTPADSIIADSSEPKSVADFREYGATCRGAEKGPESVRYSMKWLQGLREIIIDPTRAPYTADEFLGYEYETDKDGNVISEYPDRDNHGIDSVRYATNLIWKQRGK